MLGVYLDDSLARSELNARARPSSSPPRKRGCTYTMPHRGSIALALAADRSTTSNPAASILERIEAASLDEVHFYKRAVHGFTAYWCNLYVDDSHSEDTRALFDVYGETIIARAKALKLYIHAIHVRKSPSLVSGKQAFPRTGAPVPSQATTSTSLLPNRPASPKTSTRKCAKRRKAIKKPEICAIAP